MSNKIAFLIPDISGFTKFLSTTEISHSKHIIQELMDLLLKETKKAFHVAEVEGDALFLYQDAASVKTEDIVTLAKNSFIAFHKHLMKYNQLRICNCGACSTAVDLTLKFVTHYGEVEFVKVSGKEKPYGLDVIKAHRLLKNSVEGREYLLFSKDFINLFGLPNNDKVIDGFSEYPEIGQIAFSYLNIGHLRNNLKADEEAVPPKNQKLRTIADHSIEINAPVNVVYEVLSEFKYRPIWNKEAKVVDHNEEDIYRIGTEHFCIINNKKFKIKTIADNSNGLEFGEQILNNGIFKELNLYFIFNKTDDEDNKTKLSIEIRVEIKSFFKPLISCLIKPKINKKILEMSEIIKELSEKIHLERVDQTISKRM